MIAIIKYIHLLALVAWMGSMLFFSFIGAPAVFNTLDRKTAGDVVGAIFPKYYIIGYVCSITMIATLAFMGSRGGYTFPVKGGLVILGLMAALSFYSGLVIQPKAHAVKHELRAETDETKQATLKKRFGKLHGISMALNVSVIVLGLVLIYFTTRYLTIL